MSTRSYTQSATVDLDLWPWDPNSKGVPPLVIHNVPVKFERDWAKTVIAIVSTRSYTQNAIVNLWHRNSTSIEFLLIIHNAHVKFESDRAKTVVCNVSTRSYTQSAIVDLDLWPRDQKSIGFRLSSFTTYPMWSLKVIGQKLVVIMSTRSYTQNATVEIDLWPRDPKSIGFFLSSSTSYM